MDKYVLQGQIGAAGRMVPMSDVLRIATEVALGLRRSMARNGIRQMADFVNGMAFAGVLLQKNYRPEDEARSFAQTFEEEARKYADVLLAEQYQEYRQGMVEHHLGITDQSPTEMLITAGLSAEGTLAEIGEEYGLSRQDVMDVVTIIMVLAIVSFAAGDHLEHVLEGIIKGVREKTKAWDALVPSDDEMLGDNEE